MPSSGPTVAVEFHHQVVNVDAGESVLDALLRAHHAVPNSCRAGLCQACLLQSDESWLQQSDAVRLASQQGLSPQQILSHHFLACCCFPSADLKAELPDRKADWQAEVVGRQLLSPRVLELRLSVAGDWQPGQHVLLWKNEHCARLYSIASHPGRDGVMVLHVSRHAKGEVSRWCHDQLQVGDRLRLSPPNGHCVYEADDTETPLLLVAIGTGLAAVLGVVKDALAQHHQGPIAVYFAAAHPDEVYLGEELAQLAQQHSHLEVRVISRSVEQPLEQPLGSQQQETLEFGDLLDAVRLNQKSLRGTRVYLCGAEQVVAALQKLCFFAGASRHDMITEAFPSGQGS